MLLLENDQFIKCKFLLPAGSAESNTALTAVFNQYRSPLLEKFVENFNELTKHIPADISLITLVYLPISAAKFDNLMFDVKYPKVSYFFKKLFHVRALGVSDFIYLEVDILNLLKLSLLKAYSIKYKFIDILLSKRLFKIYQHSFKSFTTFLPRKQFIFSIYTLSSVLPVTFYKLEISVPFKRFFFVK